MEPAFFRELDSQSRPSYKPSPVVAQVAWGKGERGGERMNEKVKYVMCVWGRGWSARVSE